MPQQMQTTLASKLHVPLAIIACLARVGFLVWLGMNAEPTDLAMEDEISEEELEAAEEVSHEDFAADPMQWEDSLIRFTDLRVAESLGAFAFWADIPDVDEDADEDADEDEEEEESVRQLFVLSDRIIELRQHGVDIPEDDAFELVGEMRSVDAEVIEAWTDRGIIPQAEAEAVEGIESYIIVYQLPEIEADVADQVEAGEEDPEAAADGDPDQNGDSDNDTDEGPDL